MKPQLEEEWLKSQKTCKMLPKYMGDGALILKKKGEGEQKQKQTFVYSDSLLWFRFVWV